MSFISDKKIALLSKSDLKTFSRGHTDEEDTAMEVEADRWVNVKYPIDNRITVQFI